MVSVDCWIFEWFSTGSGVRVWSVLEVARFEPLSSNSSSKLFLRHRKVLIGLMPLDTAPARAGGVSRHCLIRHCSIAMLGGIRTGSLAGASSPVADAVPCDRL